MALPHRLSVPPPYVPAFRDLSTLSPESANAVLKALIGVRDDPASRTALIRAVEAAAPHIDAETLVDALCTLQASRETVPTEVIARDVAESRALDLSGEDQEIFAKRLATALSAPAILKLGRAYDVMVERERVLTSVRILTDVRPLFLENAKELPAAAVIAHNLKLTFFSDGGRDSLYIGLDDNDLEVLIEAVERAREKSRTLRDWLAKTGLPHVDSGVE